MITFNALQFVVVAMMARGLLSVILQPAPENPRGLWDMVDDDPATFYDPRLSA